MALVGNVIRARKIESRTHLIEHRGKGMPLSSALEAVGWDPLSASVFQDMVRDTPEGVAVFDADGTLWDGDAGELMFQELNRRGLLQGTKAPIELLRRYHEMCDEDATKAYGWIVQQMAGLPVAEVHLAADEVMAEHTQQHVFEPMVGLARWLEEAGWESWIVSASAEVVVQAGARHLGLREDRVLGVRLDTSGERYLPAITQMPNLEGKVDAIRSAQLVPTLAAGNSINDVPMLRESRGLKLCVNPSDQLYEQAVEQNWICVAMSCP